MTEALQLIMQAKDRPNRLGTILGLRNVEPAALIRSVERGLSFSCAEKLQRKLHLDEKDFLTLVHVSPRTFDRRKKTGRLNSEESDRIVRAAKVYCRAIELFEGDPDAALHWLSEPAPSLGGKTPLRYCTTEVGAREVENLLERLEQGVFT